MNVERAGRPSRRPDRSPAAPPGRGSMIAVVVLTGLVVLFAAVVAFWMYWLQGSLPS